MATTKRKVSAPKKTTKKPSRAPNRSTKGVKTPLKRPRGAIPTVNPSVNDIITAQQSFKRKGQAGVDLPLKDFMGVIALAYRAVGPAGGGKRGA